MRSAVLAILVSLVAAACGNSSIVRNSTAPSGKTMMRMSCPGGMDACRAAAEDECENRGFQSETSAQEEGTMWFRCFPPLRGDVRETKDSQGRKAWADRCQKRETCLADAHDLCPEGYATQDAGSKSERGITMVFRCKGDSD